MSDQDIPLGEMLAQRLFGRVLPIEEPGEKKKDSFGSITPDELTCLTESLYVELVQPVTDEPIKENIFFCFEASGWSDFSLDDDPVFRRGSVCIEETYFDVYVFFNDRKSPVGRKVLCVNIMTT